uniref:Kunitz domain n=1 Tax=Argas monolakensis TaxID=34602 RepID=Q09JX2_ARGMO|nr:Kunitz domain [Argas monolakensis]
MKFLVPVLLLVLAVSTISRAYNIIYVDDPDEDEEEKEQGTEAPVIVAGDSLEDVENMNATEQTIYYTCRTRFSAGKKCKNAQDTVKYYHNPKTKQCEAFTFHGCGGNNNRFNTKRECERFCRVKPDGICGLPSEYGICRAYFIRYFFDWRIYQCVSFGYGGCGGNANNFETLEECRAKCHA